VRVIIELAQFPLHPYSKFPRRLRDASNYRSVPEKLIAGLLLDLGRAGLVLLPAVILFNVFIIVRHDHGEDLRLLLPVGETLAALKSDLALSLTLWKIKFAPE
jgi:hypothetical protein